MGNEKEVTDTLKEVLNTSHRTLQQNFFRWVIVESIKYFNEEYNEKSYDLRNEASCELAHKLESITKDSPLPFV